MATVGIYEARTRLSKLIAKVSKGEEVTVTRHGLPVARIVPIDNQRKISIDETIESIEKFSRGKTLRGNLKKAIEEGRM